MITLDDVQPRAAALDAPHAAPRLAVQVLEFLLFVCLLSSFLTTIQPAPYEGLAALVGFACLIARVPIDVKIMPMVFLLFLLQIGGVASLVPVLGDKDAQTFVFISIYLAISGVIFAALMTDDTARRFAIIRSGDILAAVIAAILGMLGYFKAFPGSEIFLMNDRAVSTFKDPNITGPFYIPPLLYLIARFITDRVRPLHLVASLIIAVGLLLAFSRAAWGQFVFATLLMLTLLFITRTNGRARQRLMMLTLMAVATVAVLITVLFSIESVRDMILQRATLLQAYDTGTEGSRFNIQQRSIEMLLEHPNGMGPWVFGRIYGLVSHNSYLGVFLNHGWIGGVSYIALVVLTIAVGFRAVFVPTPWRDATIATLAAYVGLALESFIVDTDHWRLYYLLVGMVWGMFAATVNYTRSGKGNRTAAGESGFSDDRFAYR